MMTETRTAPGPLLELYARLMADLMAKEAEVRTGIDNQLKLAAAVNTLTADRDGLKKAHAAYQESSMEVRAALEARVEGLQAEVAALKAPPRVVTIPDAGPPAPPTGPDTGGHQR